MLELNDIQMKFKDHIIFNSLNFHGQAGEIIGLVAPNGTGKTTLFNIINHHVQPTGGTLTFFQTENYQNASSILSVHQRLCTFPQQSDLFNELSGIEHLQLYARAWKKNKQSIHPIIDELQMAHYVKKKVKTYSLGMRQRLCFAMILAADTEIMLMDEMMNGLDIENVQLISNVLLRLKTEGKLIIVASHLLENLDLYADRVIYLKDKGIALEHSVDDMTERYLKLTITSEDYAKLKDKYPHTWINEHLFCIPIAKESTTTVSEWLDELIHAGFTQLTIGPLGTKEYYQQLYGGNKE